jgi:hypothetical protein
MFAEVLSIVKVIKQGVTNARVLLNDERKVKVPISMGVVGLEIPVTDIQDILISGKVDWIHSSLRKEKRKPKVLVAVREVPKSEYEKNQRAFNDRKIIRACILKYMRSLPKHHIFYDDLEDLTSSIYEHLLLRGFFEGYDASKSAYTTWIYRAVKNYIITMWRSRDREFNLKMAHLDECFAGEEAEEDLSLYDVVSDKSLISSEEKLIRDEVSGRFKFLAEQLDDIMEYEDGLPSYLEIYEAVRDNVFEDLIENYVSSYRKKQFLEKYQCFKQHCLDTYLSEMTG